MVERKQVEKVAREVVALIMEKNATYRDNFAALGMEGLFVGYHRKVMNLKSMVWDNRGAFLPGRIREEVRDLAAMGLLGMILIDGVDGHVSGEPQRKSGPGTPTSRPAAAVKRSTPLLPIGGLLDEIKPEVVPRQKRGKNSS